MSGEILKDFQDLLKNNLKKQPEKAKRICDAHEQDILFGKKNCIEEEPTHPFFPHWGQISYISYIKVLGKRSVQIEPFFTLLEKFLPMPLIFLYN